MLFLPFPILSNTRLHAQLGSALNPARLGLF